MRAARVGRSQRTLRAEIESVKEPLDFALAIAISKMDSKPIAELIVAFDGVLVFAVSRDLGRVEIAETYRVRARAAAGRRRQIARDREEVRENGGAGDLPVFHSKRVRQPEVIGGQKRRAEIKQDAWTFGRAGDVVLAEVQSVRRCGDGHGAGAGYSRNRSRRPSGDSGIPINAGEVLDEGEVDSALL